jgi:hypothetical protein
MAQRHVAEGEAHVARQETLIAGLDRDGHTELAAEARALLTTLETSLRLMRADLSRIENEPPETVNTPGKRALFNNLNQNEELASRIDETVKKTRPDDWRGVQPKERVIKAALYGVLQDAAEVERIFLIIKAQKEY